MYICKQLYCIMMSENNFSTARGTLPHGLNVIDRTNSRARARNHTKFSRSQLNRSRNRVILSLGAVSGLTSNLAAREGWVLR